MRKKKSWKQFLAIALSVALIFSVLPDTAVFASEGASGTETDVTVLEGTASGGQEDASDASQETDKDVTDSVVMTDDAWTFLVTNDTSDNFEDSGAYQKTDANSWLFSIWCDIGTSELMFGKYEKGILTEEDLNSTELKDITTLSFGDFFSAASEDDGESAPKLTVKFAENRDNPKDDEFRKITVAKEESGSGDGTVDDYDDEIDPTDDDADASDAEKYAGTLEEDVYLYLEQSPADETGSTYKTDVVLATFCRIGTYRFEYQGKTADVYVGYKDLDIFYGNSADASEENIDLGRNYRYSDTQNTFSLLSFIEVTVAIEGMCKIPSGDDQGEGYYEDYTLGFFWSLDENGKGDTSASAFITAQPVMVDGAEASGSWTLTVDPDKRQNGTDPETIYLIYSEEPNGVTEVKTLEFTMQYNPTGLFVTGTEDRWNSNENEDDENYAAEIEDQIADGRDYLYSIPDEWSWCQNFTSGGLDDQEVFFGYRESARDDSISTFGSDDFVNSISVYYYDSSQANEEDRWVDVTGDQYYYSLSQATETYWSVSQGKNVSVDKEGVWRLDFYKDGKYKFVYSRDDSSITVDARFPELGVYTDKEQSADALVRNRTLSFGADTAEFYLISNGGNTVTLGDTSEEGNQGIKQKAVRSIIRKKRMAATM